MDELLTFGVGVDTSAAEAGLASLGGSAEGVAAGLEDRLAGATDGLKELGKQSSQASRGIQGLASVVSLVDPRLGQVIRSVGTLARGMTVLRLGLGPAAVAVAAVTTALALYRRQQDEAAEQERRAAAVSDIMREARDRLKDSTLDLNVELGKLTATEREILKIRQQAFVESLPAVQEFTAQIAEQSRAVAAAEDQLLTHSNAMRGVSIRYEEGSILAQNLAAETHLHAENVKEAGLAYQEEQGKMQALQDQYGEFLGTLRETVNQRVEQVKAEEANANATRRSREETTLATQGERERAAAIKEVADLEREALVGVMSEQQRLNFILQERLDRLQEIAQQSQGTIDVEAAEAALRKQYALELGEIREQEHQDQMRRLEAERQEARDAALERLQVGTDLANNLAGLATQSFGNTKGAQIAEARLAQLLAFANAVARDPTPLGALRGAAAAASIEAQIQSMRGTTLTAHRGYVGDEVPATYRRGEAVLSPQGRRAIGDDNIRRANSGQGSRPTVLQVRQMYEHRGYNRFADDNLKIGGPIREAIRASSGTLTGLDAD